MTELYSSGNICINFVDNHLVLGKNVARAVEMISAAQISSSILLVLAHNYCSSYASSYKDGVEEGGRIVGGKEAVAGQFPYQALLLLNKPPEYINAVCGGALISNRHVLTAGHCTYQFDDIKVILGNLHYREYTEGDHSVVVSLNRTHIHVHPMYDPYTLLNDIGILEFPKPVNFTDFIQPASLPLQNETNIDYYTGKEGIITGWGLTEKDEFSLPEKLRFAKVTVMDHSKCLSYYQLFDVENSQICTSYNGSGTCNGDSGGPLVYEEGKRRVMLGVTSFGTTNCTEVAPSVYTYVASFLPWILNYTTTQS